jgi:hypothetical protein
MTTISALTIICVLAAIAFAVAYWLARNAEPDLRTIDDMNADEAKRAQARKTKAYIDGLWDVKP